MRYETIDAVSVAGKTITVNHNDDITEDEINEADHRALTRGYDNVCVTVEDDSLLLEYRVPPVPFERIRRITGYLVGTTARWNNGKVAELNDRVKHDMPCAKK